MYMYYLFILCFAILNILGIYVLNIWNFVILTRVWGWWHVCLFFENYHFSSIFLFVGLKLDRESWVCEINDLSEQNTFISLWNEKWMWEV